MFVVVLVVKLNNDCHKDACDKHSDFISSCNIVSQQYSSGKNCAHICDQHDG